jgi:hypothetical protein
MNLTPRASRAQQPEARHEQLLRPDRPLPPAWPRASPSLSADVHLNVLNNSAMIVGIFEHVQWRWALNGSDESPSAIPARRLLGCGGDEGEGRTHAGQAVRHLQQAWTLNSSRPNPVYFL